jgi:hypothetical protein
LRNDGVVTPCIQHSNRLGTLARKYKSKLFHEFLYQIDLKPAQNMRKQLQIQ